MRRTRRRALPRHIVSPLSATVFGVVLGVLATVVLLVWVNPLSALLALAAEAFYLVVYTMILKRRTTQNIVWGGLAGCFPTLIGWTAVTGSLAWEPVVLFLVVFFWTPPHTWALALRYREDYAGVDVPMLPVVASAAEVGRQIVLYSVAMVATSMLLWPVASTGWLYPVAAAVLGAAFLVQAVLMWRRSIGTEDLGHPARWSSSTPRTCTCRSSSSPSRWRRWYPLITAAANSPAARTLRGLRGTTVGLSTGAGDRRGLSCGPRSAYDVVPGSRTSSSTHVTAARDEGRRRACGRRRGRRGGR